MNCCLIILKIIFHLNRGATTKTMIIYLQHTITNYIKNQGNCAPLVPHTQITTIESKI